jgi:hypothetical protein
LNGPIGLVVGCLPGRGFYDDNDQRVAELTSRLCRIALELDRESS